MSLSQRSIENLLDLVAIKIGAMQVLDCNDAREFANLEACWRELIAMQTTTKKRKAVRYGPKQPEVPVTAH